MQLVILSRFQYVLNNINIIKITYLKCIWIKVLHIIHLTLDYKKSYLK